MNYLLIQQGPGKFLQNCPALSLDDLSIIDIVIDNNLYKTFFKYKPSNCIFSANAISNEIIQFCQDYSNSIKIYFFVLNDSSLPQLKSTINSSIKTIGYANTDIIIPQSLINDQLFYNKPSLRTDGIVCFMDGVSNIENSMMNLLYPNTTIPIKMFNCPNIKHYQNLGTLTEEDRAAVLQTHKYYLDLDLPPGLNYKQEAVACGCIPVTIEDVSNNTYYNKSIVNTELTNTIITYSHFLKDILNYE